MGIMEFLLGPKGKSVPQAAVMSSEVSHESTENPAASVKQSIPQVIGMLSDTIDRDSYIASDENEWICYMRQTMRQFRKPGVTLHEEYHQWLAARERARKVRKAAVREVSTT